MRGIGVVVVCLAATAHAGRPEAVRVQGDSTCPAAAAVARLLGDLMPSVAVSTGRGPAGALVVTLEDWGVGYRVAFEGGERRFIGDAGACAERVRKVAVFVALTLDPPSLSPGRAPATLPPLPSTPAPPPSAPSTPRVAVPPPVPPRDTSLAVELEAAALAVIGADDPRVPLNAGGGLRVVLLRDWVGGALGVAGVAPAAIVLAGGGQAQVTRVPFDIDLRVRFREQRVQLSGDLGVSMAVAVLDAFGMRRTAFEAGVRLDAAVSIRLHDRVRPFVGVEAALVPAPISIADGTGTVVGNTPHFWVGLRAGLAVRVR